MDILGSFLTVRSGVADGRLTTVAATGRATETLDAVGLLLALPADRFAVDLVARVAVDFFASDLVVLIADEETVVLRTALFVVLGITFS